MTNRLSPHWASYLYIQSNLTMETMLKVLKAFALTLSFPFPALELTGLTVMNDPYPLSRLSFLHGIKE